MRRFAPGALCLSLLPVLLADCTVEIPDGKLVCSARERCPSGFTCQEERCVRGGVDAAIERDADGEQADADEPDAEPAPADAGCDAMSCIIDDDATRPCEGASCPDAGPLCAPELCNGLDDDCDGLADQELPLTLVELAELPAEPRPYDLQLLRTSDGRVVVITTSLVEIDDQELQSIFATILALDGSVLSGPALLGQGARTRSAAVLVDEGIALVHASTTGYGISIFDLADFSERAPRLPLAADYVLGAAVDIRLTTDALGERLWILYEKAGALTLATLRPNDPTSLEDVFEAHRPASGERPYDDARLAAAPCNRGLYVLLRRFLPSEDTRVLGFTAEGTATGFDVALHEAGEGRNLTMANPVLSPGDCASPPDTLYTAMGLITDIDDETSPAYLIVAAYDTRPATPSAERTRFRTRIALDHPPFPEGLTGPIATASALARRPDGTLLAATVNVEVGSATGGVSLYELDDAGAERHIPTHFEPRLPTVLDLAYVGEQAALPWFAASGFVDQGAPFLGVVSCEER